MKNGKLVMNENEVQLKQTRNSTSQSRKSETAFWTLASVLVSDRRVSV